MRGGGKRALWWKVTIALIGIIMLGIGALWRETSVTRPLRQSNSVVHKKIVREEISAPYQSDILSETYNEKVKPE